MKKIFLLLIAALFIIGCKSDYEKGVDLLKEKKYDEALVEFGKVKQDDKEYSQSQKKINFINGIKSYNDGFFDQAISLFRNVEYEDIQEANSIIETIENNPKYNYMHGFTYFKEKNYISAIDKFKKLPENTEEYKKSINKVIFIQAYNLQKNDELDSAISILQSINQADEIYSETQSLISSINRKKNFIAAKELFEKKDYEKANELLKNIQNTDDFYNEAAVIMSKINSIQLLSKYETIRKIDAGDKYYKINGKINLEIQKEDLYELSTYFDKFNDKNTFKEILPFQNYFYKDFKQDGGLNPKYGEFFGYFEVILQKSSGTSFTGDLYQLQLYNWKDYVINNANLRNDMTLNPSNYKICFIYKIDYIKYDINQRNVYSNQVKFYVLDKDNNIVFESEKANE